MPASVSPKSKDVAFSEFRYGTYDVRNPSLPEKTTWKNYRWGNNLNTHLLDDYSNLMVLLHTDEYEQALQYKESGGTRPITNLDKILNIFETILPHRKLIKKAGVVDVCPTSNPTNIYNSSEMSDGERVIFYLAGEVICAFQKCTYTKHW
jgi:hypothetical protein